MSRDARLDRLEDKLDTVVDTLTRISTQFDGVPGRVRVLEDKSLQWETGRRMSLWLLGVVGSVAGAIGAAIGWIVKLVVTNA